MALLGLVLLVGGVWLPGVDGLRILVVHPLYAGSHALTLQVGKVVPYKNNGNLFQFSFSSR